MNDLLTRILENDLVGHALDIWLAGGWAMIALAINALILFGVGMNVWMRLRARGYRSVPEKTWRGWIDRPEKRHGPVGRLIDFVMGAANVKDMGVRFSELHSTELAPFARDLKLMRRCVSTAPLLGLLGTVTGMLSTFQGLAAGSGGQKTMDLVAGGISEALITTETGLMVALPGLFLWFHLNRQCDRYDAFLAHLESVCTQYMVTWREVRRRAGPPPYTAKAG
jgi:biopolymer transport protein ExbB